MLKEKFPAWSISIRVQFIVIHSYAVTGTRPVNTVDNELNK